MTIADRKTGEKTMRDAGVRPGFACGVGAVWRPAGGFAGSAWNQAIAVLIREAFAGRLGAAKPPASARTRASRDARRTRRIRAV